MILFIFGAIFATCWTLCWHDWKVAGILADRDFWKYMATRPQQYVPASVVAEQLLADLGEAA